MTSSIAALMRNHVAYDIWATNRLLDAANQLTPEQRTRDFGTADKSVQGTLIHLFRSSRTWIGRIQKATPAVSWSSPEDENWPELRASWLTVQQQWQDWADALNEEDPFIVLHYTDLKGRPWAQPLWEIAMHVVNHGTHHRGQISGFLRASGLVPPPLDFIAFAREQQAR